MPVARKVWQPIFTRVKVHRAPLDHAPGVHPVHQFLSQRAGTAGGGAEEGSFTCVADSGGLCIRTEISFQVMMRRHFVTLATFLVQPDAPALAIRVVVSHAHGDDGADAGEGEGQPDRIRADRRIEPFKRKLYEEPEPPDRRRA